MPLHLPDRRFVAPSWNQQQSAPIRRLTASFAPKTDAAIAFDGSFLVKAGEDLPSPCPERPKTKEPAGLRGRALPKEALDAA
jgi:hypothetical protein